MRRKKLINVFSNWTSHGIFHELQLFDVPWKNENIDISLDLDYFGNTSGYKYISPLVFRILSQDNDVTLSNERISQLAGVIFHKYITTWRKEYATMFFEYNPISNYDMTEEGYEEVTRGYTKDNTGTQGIARTGTQGNTGTETTQSTMQGSADRGIYGFNSATDVDADTTTSQNSGSDTTQSSFTRTDNLSDTRTDNLSEEYTGNDEHSHTISRSGNIGVTTSQQMIESERQLYMWNFFQSVVYPDIDKVLTIATYGD